MPWNVLKSHKHFSLNSSKADSIPSEPTPIMKYKIEKENSENFVNEVNLETNES